MLTGFPLQHGKALYQFNLPIHNKPWELAPLPTGDRFTPNMISYALSQLKNNKASNSFMVKTEYLKALKDTRFLEVMAQFFNNFLVHGQFPITWSQTEASAHPLHKSRARGNQDYRYILITAILYKLYFTAVNNQVTPTCNHPMQYFQAGFRKKHSCAHHLFTLRILWNRWNPKENHYKFVLKLMSHSRTTRTIFPPHTCSGVSLNII